MSTNVRTPTVGREKEGGEGPPLCVYCWETHTHFNVLTEGREKTLFSPLTLVRLDSFSLAIHVVIQMERKGNAYTHCEKTKQTKKCGQNTRMWMGIERRKK